MPAPVAIAFFEPRRRRPHALNATTTGERELQRHDRGGTTPLVVAGRQRATAHERQAPSVGGAAGSAITPHRQQEHHGGPARPISNGAPITLTGNAVGCDGRHLRRRHRDRRDPRCARRQHRHHRQRRHDRRERSRHPGLGSSSLKSTGSGSIALTGKGGGTSGIGVSISNPGATQSISSVDGNIQITGTASGGVPRRRVFELCREHCAVDGSGQRRVDGARQRQRERPVDRHHRHRARLLRPGAERVAALDRQQSRLQRSRHQQDDGRRRHLDPEGAEGHRLHRRRRHQRQQRQTKHRPRCRPATPTRPAMSAWRAAPSRATAAASRSAAAATRRPASPGATRQTAPASTWSGTTLNAGGGDITMHGHGWSNAASSGHGIYTQSGTTIQTTGSGAIALTGVGGDLVTASQSTGVLLNQVTRVLGQDGDITITGTGGNNTGGSFGVYLDNFGNGTYGATEVVSSGIGKINITGTGGSSRRLGRQHRLRLQLQCAGAERLRRHRHYRQRRLRAAARAAIWHQLEQQRLDRVDRHGAERGADRPDRQRRVRNQQQLGININADKVIAGLTRSPRPARSRATGRPSAPSTATSDSRHRRPGYGPTTAASHRQRLWRGRARRADCGLGAASVSAAVRRQWNGSGNSGLKLLSGSSTAPRHPGVGPGASPSAVGGLRRQRHLTGTASAIENGTAMSRPGGQSGARRGEHGEQRRPRRPRHDRHSVGIGNAAPGSLSLSDAELGELSWSGLSPSEARTRRDDDRHRIRVPGALAVVSGAGADITLAAPCKHEQCDGADVTLSAGATSSTQRRRGAGPGLGAWRVYSSDPQPTRGTGSSPNSSSTPPCTASRRCRAAATDCSIASHRAWPSTLIGVAAKVYDGNTMATLAPANYALTGAIDGDSVAIGNGSAIFDKRNAATARSSPHGSPYEREQRRDPVLRLIAMSASTAARSARSRRRR